jgi:hypothetical protein
MTNPNERSGQQHQAQPDSQTTQQQKQGNAGHLGGEDISEKDEQQKGGDADNPSDSTGATESGEEDKGAK